MSSTQGPTVDLLRHEPELLDAVPRAQRARAREAGKVRVLSLEPGRWSGIGRPSDSRYLGHLVIDGVLTHRLRVGARESVEILGPGDVLRPWLELEALSIPCSPGWWVQCETKLAVLDASFSQGVSAWPHIASVLMDRLTLRTRWLSIELAIAAASRVETRLLLLLWYCADRWGRVTREGIRIELPLSHELLGEVVAARRPTVTTALAALEEQGKLRRVGRHCWMLLGEAPASVEAISS